MGIRPSRPSNRRGVCKNGNGFFLGGSPLRGAAGAARLREAQSLFRVDRSRVHGFGVFSREAVPRGMPVMEYVGEVVRRPVADRRERTDNKNGAVTGNLPSTYMFALDENDADSRVVDAARKGNLARFANHSCAPNCEVAFAEDNAVFVVTTRAVALGEELTISYVDASGTDDERREELQETYGFECRCARCERGGGEAKKPKKTAPAAKPKEAAKKAAPAKKGAKKAAPAAKKGAKKAAPAAKKTAKKAAPAAKKGAKKPAPVAKPKRKAAGAAASAAKKPRTVATKK